MKSFLCALVALVTVACGAGADVPTPIAPTPDPACFTNKTGLVKFQNTDSAHAIDIYVDHNTTTTFLVLNPGELSQPMTLSSGGHFAEYGIVGTRGQIPCQAHSGIVFVQLCAGAAGTAPQSAVTCP